MDQRDLNLTICSLSLPLAAAAQFAFPALLPVAAGRLAYTAIPCFKGAYDVADKVDYVAQLQQKGGKVCFVGDGIVAAIGVLANGVWPMRTVAQLEAKRRHARELELKAAGYEPETLDRVAD